MFPQLPAAGHAIKAEQRAWPPVVTATGGQALVVVIADGQNIPHDGEILCEMICREPVVE